MNTVKVQSLMELREVIKEEGYLTGSEYINEGGNCCVIGHLFQLGDVSEDELVELEGGVYGASSCEIGEILVSAQTSKLSNNFVKDGLEKLGFDLEKDRELLSSLQMVNDDTDGNIQEVIARIDYYIDHIQNN